MLPKSLWAELFAAGRVVHHPVFPDKQGPARPADRERDDDVREVIAVLRLNYERVMAPASGADRHGG